MTAEIAKYVAGRFRFLYYRRLGILDIYENGQDIPSKTVNNVQFADVFAFVDYCNTLVTD